MDPLRYVISEFGVPARTDQEHHARLQEVREAGTVQEWLQFFLTAVRRCADDAADTAERLVEARERCLVESFKTRSQLPAPVDLLLTNPFVTVTRVERHRGLTDQGARTVIREAERRGWVGAVGRGGRAYGMAHELVTIVEDEATY